MPDEFLGMDGLGSGCYTVSAMALVTSIVWAMPHGVIQSMAREVPSLHRRLLSALGGEIARSQVTMMMLGTMGARERLVDFLLNVSRRFLRRGYSGVTFRLCMTRGEIGSYLGLSLETVSRHFSALGRDGLIDVRMEGYFPSSTFRASNAYSARAGLRLASMPSHSPACLLRVGKGLPPSAAVVRRCG